MNEQENTKTLRWFHYGVALPKWHPGAVFCDCSIVEHSKHLPPLRIFLADHPFELPIAEMFSRVPTTDGRSPLAKKEGFTKNHGWQWMGNICKKKKKTFGIWDFLCSVGLRHSSGFRWIWGLEEGQTAEVRYPTLAFCKDSLSEDFRTIGIFENHPGIVSDFFVRVFQTWRFPKSWG